MNATSSKLTATRLTPWMPAGIATIAVRGDDAAETVLQLVRLRTKELALHRIHYGMWPVGMTDRDDASAMSQTCMEQVVVCRTEQDAVEIHCHGGNAVCREILQQLKLAGCDEVSSDTWPSQLASPISKAAESDLLRAKTDRVASVLLTQMNGALDRELSALLKMLESNEPNSSDVTFRIERLLEDGRLGLKMRDGWSVVFAGPPNVGKSSLINRIVGQTRSIVHAEAGTTRDWVESEAVLEGWPIRLTDTAGIRDASDPIESEGVRRAVERVEQADLVVLVVDAEQKTTQRNSTVGETSEFGWTDSHTRVARLAKEPVLICLNKWDKQVAKEDSSQTIEQDFVPREYATKKIVTASATSEPGVSKLMESIFRAVVPSLPTDGAAVPFREEQVDALEEALASVRESDWDSARKSLRGLLGENVSE